MIRQLIPYERNPKLIYAASFATVKKEANLERFSPEMQSVVIRLIHACGMIEIADRVAYSANAANAGSLALAKGAPILCDCEMVGAGIIRRYLPANNKVIVTLNEANVPELANSIGNTRSAAAVELWEPHIKGSVVAIGNAPTALFHLLELLDSALNLRGFCVLGAEAVDPAFGLVDLALLSPVLFFENFAAQGGFFYEEGIISRIFSGLSALKCYGSGCQFIKKRAIM